MIDILRTLVQGSNDPDGIPDDAITDETAEESIEQLFEDADSRHPISEFLDRIWDQYEEKGWLTAAQYQGLWNSANGVRRGY